MKPDEIKIKGSIPEHYDLGLGPVLFQEHGRELARQVAQKVPANVLELAAGTGILSRHLRDALEPTCHLTVTDIVGPMLDVAKGKFKECETALLFEVADAQNLPFESETYDMVVCQFGVMLFPDKQASFNEVLRVLRPKGHYVFNIWQSFEENAFAKVTHDTIAGFFENDPPQFWRMPFSYHDKPAVTDALQSAGFVNIQIEPRELHVTVPDFNRFAQGLVFGNPLVHEIRSRDTVEPEVVHLAILESLREEFGSEPSTIRLKSYIVTGSRPT